MRIPHKILEVIVINGITLNIIAYFFLKRHKMVYCSKCGTKNEDDVKYCTSCGASLTGRRERRSEEYEDICFGRHGDSKIGIAIFGAILLIVGISWIVSEITGFEAEIFWPSIGILVGSIIILSAILNQRASGGRAGSQIGWIIFGSIILVFGISGIVREVYQVEEEFGWALAVVLVGIIIIVSTITGRKT